MPKHDANLGLRPVLRLCPGQRRENVESLCAGGDSVGATRARGAIVQANRFAVQRKSVDTIQKHSSRGRFAYPQHVPDSVRDPVPFMEARNVPKS